MHEVMPMPFRFTRDLYDRMVAAGILSESDRVELIRGEILLMSPIGPSHSSIVQALIRVLGRSLPDPFELRVQDPIALSADSEPEPDIAVVRARADGYQASHPAPADVMLIIEVAISSLDFDLNQKADLYAAAQVPEYWVLDVPGLRAHVHRAPRDGRYSQITVHERHEQLAITAIQGLVIGLRAIFR